MLVAFSVGVLTVLHVLVGFAKTPGGMIYLWTGHYYLDYYYYLQFIAQGLRGYWLPRQYSATDDPSIYFHLEPYIVIGQLGRFFHLNPISAYWISVFLLAVILALSIFLLIREVLKDRPFYLQFSSYLLALFAGPFFKLASTPAGLQINSFDYWASYGNFFKKFEPVPHHLIAHILTLITFLVYVRYIKDREKNILKTARYAFLLSLIMVVELSFYPFQAMLVFAAIVITSFFYSLYYLMKRQIRSSLSLLVFTCSVVVLSLLAGVLLKNIYDKTILFAKIKEMEVAWRNKVPIEAVLLNLGPTFILSLFGLKEFVKKINAMAVLLVAFVLMSFILFYSPLDRVLNTHNGRFLSPINYILLGSLGGLGIFYLSLHFGHLQKYLFVFLTFLFLLFSFPPHIQAFLNIVRDKNLDSPISYLPKGIVDGFKFLAKYQEKGDVLMTPSQFLGTVLPAFTDRRSYVSRHPETPNYIEKNIRTSNFYLGAMSNREAHEFLQKNGLNFVVLTSIEGYEVKPLYRYPFLKQIYRNRDLVIFKLL